MVKIKRTTSQSPPWHSHTSGPLPRISKAVCTFTDWWLDYGIIKNKRGINWANIKYGDYTISFNVEDKTSSEIGCLYLQTYPKRTSIG
eukprot:scaffold381_cov168-Ochromonas_danica.AAC.22